MTVNASTRRSGPYSGTGLIVGYSFNFKVFAATDLLVVTAVIATGITTNLVLDSGYSVNLNADQDANPGGTVFYMVAGVPTALPVGLTLTIVGNLPFTQPTDITNLGGFYPQVIEDALDREVMLVQQTNDAVDRALLLNVATNQAFNTQLPAPVPTSLFGWAPDGLSIVNYAVGIYADTAALIGALASSIGSSLIGFIQAGVGSVITTLQTWLRRRPLTPEDFGAAFNNLSVDSTAGVQACIDSAITQGRPIELLGLYSVGPINLNGTGHATPADNQWTCVSSVRGAGRFGACGFVARAGLYGSNQFVVTANNFSGVTFQNWGVDGNGVTNQGANLSWIGGSGGSPSAAPSNQNVIENIFVSGTNMVVGINLDNNHDSNIGGIWSRNASTTGIGISMQNGDGGTMTIRDSWTTGLFNISCQEGAATNFGFFNGVKLVGAGFNHLAFTGGQISPNVTTGACVDSATTGNATRGCVFDAIYFDNMTYCLRGRWHEGASFNGCHFGTWTSLVDAGNFVPAGGAGNIPLFIFQNCSFLGALPATVTGLYRVLLIGCRDSSGNIFSSNDGANFVSVMAASGGGYVAGNATLVMNYVRNGDDVHLEMIYTHGSTTVAGTGSYTWTVPFLLSTATPKTGLGYIVHAGAITQCLVTGATTGSIKLTQVPSTTTVGAATPFALATGDQIILSLDYITNSD